VGAFSCVILFRASGSATDFYEDKEVRFAYRLVKIYETDAREIVGQGPLCLLPFVPLIKHGTGLVDQADALICYRARRCSSPKAAETGHMASGWVRMEGPFPGPGPESDVALLWHLLAVSHQGCFCV